MRGTGKRAENPLWFRANNYVGGWMKRIAQIVMIAASFGLAAPAMAEGLKLSGSSKSRETLFKSQARLLDGRLSKQYSASARLQPKPTKNAAGSESDGALPRFRGNYKGQYLEVAKAAARKHGVPEDLFLRLVQQESGWNPGAVSTAGARGLAQLMPGTARLMRVNIDDPQQNLDGGAKYLALMYSKLGNWRLALAAYNAGPQAVDKHGGVPPYRETTNYVKVVYGG